MNNIDILEEKEKEAIKDLEKYLHWEELQGFSMLPRDKHIETILNLVSTIIAENKELKEEKDSLKKEVIHWKGEYHLENRKYLDLYNKKVSIPTINATEEMLEQYVEKIKIIENIEELEDYIQYSANPLSIDNSKFAIKILQSLLGKE